MSGSICKKTHVKDIKGADLNKQYISKSLWTIN